MINWFMGLPFDHQSLIIVMATIVIGGIVAIIGAICPREAAVREELQQKQEKVIGKMK